VIIRHKHTGSFTVVPNAIFNDDRLSLTAKGLLGYLLSRPRNWEVRHDQLQRKLDIGRKLLSKLLNELREAGYLERDEEQGRDDQNRFTTLNYVVRDIPELTAADVPTPLRSEPPDHQRQSAGNCLDALPLSTASLGRRIRKGWGVVKSLAGFPCGPAGLVHTQKVGIKYKKPTSQQLVVLRGHPAISLRLAYAD
jgi:hypothetical protein